MKTIQGFEVRESNQERQQSAQDERDPTQDHQSLTFLQVLQSTLAAAFGVQSSKKRKRDFTHGKASHFIMMGIGFTAVFVLIMAGLVNLILSLT